jgi:micrococcal nuclease
LSRSLAPLLLLFLFITIACDDPGDIRQAATLSPSPSPSSVPPTATTVTLPDGLTQALVTNVVDGDTIDVEIEGVEYRLRYIGIDTPETVDPRRPVGCLGPEASAYNRQLVEGRTVGLEKDVSETDQFGRLLRYVWLPAEATPSGQAEMVNAVLVREGYAQASTYPPDVKHQDLFLQLQSEARLARRGLWGDVCTSPVPTAVPTGGSAGQCEFSGTTEPVIKGNISTNSGERIYHVPGQEYYDETVITEAKGERWFCTEAEAVAAGWRKAKV